MELQAGAGVLPLMQCVGQGRAEVVDEIFFAASLLGGLGLVASLVMAALQSRA